MALPIAQAFLAQPVALALIACPESTFALGIVVSVEESDRSCRAFRCLGLAGETAPDPFK